MKKNRLTLKIFALIVMSDLGDTLAQFIMKKALALTGITSINFGNIAEFAARAAGSPILWLGLAVYIFNFFIWIVILYKIDLSIAIPVGSFCYIFVPLAAVFFLGEHVGIMRWAGIFLIVLGIHFVSQSTKIMEGI